PVPNKLPQVNAGTDQAITLPLNTVTLKGTASDADGSIVSYLWEKLSGPACTIATPGAAQTSVTGMQQGSYSFKLTVTDNMGATASDTVSVVVNKAPNQAPVADAGADQNITLPANSVQLQGKGTDSDGTVTKYNWSRISGPFTYSFSDSTLASPVVSGLVAGTYIFKLTVTDNDGAIASDNITLIVNPAPNKPPVVNAGNDIVITLPINTIKLAGTGSDSDGVISKYTWTKVSGPQQYSIVSSTTDTTTVTALIAGDYIFRLTVTDNAGSTAFDEVKVTVKPAPNKIPVANAGADIEITLPVDSATLNGSGIDSDGVISQYKWSKVSGPVSSSIKDVLNHLTTVSTLMEGTYVFRLTVTDNAGDSAYDDIKVIVHPKPNQIPLVNSGKDVAITLPVDSVKLSGSASDPDGTIVKYQWTKVSGAVGYSWSDSTVASPVIRNLKAGTYTLRLTVTDNSGATASDDVVIIVNEAINQAPVADAGKDVTLTLPTDSIKLVGKGTDADGQIAGYHWAILSAPANYSKITSDQETFSLLHLIKGQ
ncbi:MAG TPA: PKD domain-containing protein, partial [Flavisolibacter sp.]|nr:PKD domain-containing protein [Flavisolibacter sp.]